MPKESQFSEKTVISLIMQGQLIINNIVFFETSSFRTQLYSITTFTKSFKSLSIFLTEISPDPLEKGHFEKNAFEV